MKINDFIPPILSHSLKNMFASKIKVLNLELYSTYADALNICDNTGYEHANLVETVFEKTRRIKNQMLNRKIPLSDSATQSLSAVLLSLWADENRRQFTVIDFGGACGAHYFQLRPFLPPGIHTNWAIVETPAMVEKARAFETDELFFFKSLKEAREKLQVVDLIHSSGTIQYVPAPETTIKEFISCQPAFIFLNRLALSASDEFITIQESLLSANGPGAMPDGFQDKLCRYPITYFSKCQLEEMLSKSFRVEFELAQTSALVGKETIINAGLFWARN